MSRILAIEPDPERMQALRQLVRDRLDTDVVLAESANAAIAEMSERPVDLILTSVLMSPSDDSRLATYLKGRDGARNLSVLIIPPMVDQAQPPPTKSTRLLSHFRRSPAPFWPAYDPDVVAHRIREALTGRAPLEEDAAADARDLTTPAPATIDALGDTAASAEEDPQQHKGGVKRPRAQRLARTDAPWASRLTLPSGLELQLLNISSSGLLVESRQKLEPGQSTAFQFWGPIKNRRGHQRPPRPRLVAPARIVRIEMEVTNGRGARYRTAAMFDGSVDLSVIASECGVLRIGGDSLSSPETTD